MGIQTTGASYQPHDPLHVSAPSGFSTLGPTCHLFSLLLNKRHTCPQLPQLLTPSSSQGRLEFFLPKANNAPKEPQPFLYTMGASPTISRLSSAQSGNSTTALWHIFLILPNTSCCLLSSLSPKANSQLLQVKNCAFPLSCCNTEIWGHIHSWAGQPC